MATIITSSDEKVYQIKKWLGVNECPDGDTQLKNGEAAFMKNFRVTADGALQVRSGTKTIITLGSGTVYGLWTGYVDGSEVMVAACDGKLWNVDTEDWTKTEIGSVTTSQRVHMFGYSEKLYIMNGTQYKAWDGTTLSDVAGYRPCVAIATPPAGGGTLLEQVNKLTASKSQKFSPDGTADDFQLAETDIASIDYVKLNGTETTAFTYVLATGIVTMTSVPIAGTDTLEIGWTGKTSDRATVLGMRFSETYNGTTDNRVFLYGDGTNQTLYSGIDANGQATAEYFPDLNVMHVGDENTPVTAMIRHYNRLLAFKEDSAYSVYYSTISLTDGTATAGFYLSTINKSVGNIAPGQVVLVDNHPRAFDGNSIYEWTATSTSGNVTGDQRNAKRISKKIETTLETFTLSEVTAFNDKFNHEYYAIQNGTAIVNNYGNDTWYVYDNFPAVCMADLDGEIYFGTDAGAIRRVSAVYREDIDGETRASIDARWESGSMSFSADFRRKYSAMLWVGLKPESATDISITIQTDKKNDFESKTIESNLATLKFANFASWSFYTNHRPYMTRIKLKAKKFTFYKLIFTAGAINTTATVVSADIRVRYTGNVR